jgi:predicted DNA-binding transcriptional regulator
LGEFTDAVAVMEQLLVNSESQHLLGVGALEKALVHQWVGYAYNTIVPAGDDLGLQKSYSKVSSNFR